MVSVSPNPWAIFHLSWIEELLEDFCSGKLGGCRCPTISWRHHMQITWYCLIFLLVGGIPVVSILLWKIWVRQLGWWNSQLIWKKYFLKIFKTTNQLVCMKYILIYIYEIIDHVIICNSQMQLSWPLMNCTNYTRTSSSSFLDLSALA